jgi:cytochrome P450
MAEHDATDIAWDPATAWTDLRADRVDGAGPVYADLLSRCPVAHIPAAGIGPGATTDYWAILGHDEIALAARNHKAFSNVTPTQGPRILPLQSDPPEHAGYRRMMNPFFSAEQVGRLEPEVRRDAGAMIDAMIAAGTADFAQEFAFPFPTRTLCHFLQVPDEDWPIHHDWVMAMEAATGDGLLDPDQAVPAELAGAIIPYVQKVIERRRAHPGDDVVSGIMAAEIGGEPLDDMAVTFLIITVMLAGHITTTSATGNLVLRLARDPELQARLRADPSRIPDAIEECLRIDAPQQAMPRRCLVDTTVGGHTIPAGDRVLLNWGSANLDPAHWARPETFDLDRADQRHLAFGRGVHQCIGAALARMELRVTAEELLARTASFALDGPVRRTAWPRMSVEALPLALSARA